MTATVLSAVATCLVSLSLGQAALRIAGAREWSWLAPSVGISVAMLISVTALHLPGRCTTVAVLLAVLTVAASIWCGLAPEHRPPLGGVLAAAPVALLMFVPFLAAGHSGILGVSVDNDMGSHMLFAEAYLSEAVAHVAPLPPDYPLGPHAMVAVIAKGFEIRIDQSFTGWTMALPVVNAWTAVALARRSSWLKQVLVATVVGVPFLVAAYYGEGSFKEVLQAGLVLAFALSFAGYGPSLARGRWVTPALLVGGMLSVYSVTGLPWPGAIVALWLGGLLVQHLARRGGRGIADLKGILRAELPALGIGLLVLFVALIPQLRRIHNFISMNLGGNGIITPKGNFGNLVGPLPGWEAFGVWNNADFRLPASPAFTGGMWTALVVALVLFGAIWAFRSGRWLLPLTAGASLLIWAISTHSQSPYVSAKGLVIASPLLLAVAVLPLLDSGPRRLPRSLSAVFDRVPGQPMAWALAAILAVVLFARVGVSDVQALRASTVGSTDHMEQLRTLRPLIQGKPTLFLGDDDFVEWELAGVPVQPAIVQGAEKVPLRPQKKWSEGIALDFDSVDAATLNSYLWVITTRDAAGSAPPPQLHPVRTTADYVLWHRVGRVRQRSVLQEGGMPGAVLDCQGAAGRAILRAGGVAAVRAAPEVATGASLSPGATAAVQLVLPRGSWDVEAAYVGSQPVDVTGGGIHTTLPALLDRPGPRWPIGHIAMRQAGTVTLSLHAQETPLTPSNAPEVVFSVIATPRSTERIVPVHAACGQYVDWYRSVSG